MRLLARADGGRDGGDVEGMRAERRHQQRAQARERDDGVGAGLESVVAQHQHAGHVLAGQRDQEQRQGHAEQGVEREFRPREHGRRESQLQPGQVHTVLRQQECQAQRQDADHGVARRQPLEQHIGHDQQAGQHRVHAHAAKGLDAELQQDARQQARGHARRNQPDHALEPARQPQQHEGRRRHHIGADRLRIRRGGQRRHQEGRRRRGPGCDDGLAREPAQHQSRDAHADRDRPHPGRRELRAQAGHLGGLEHQDEGAAVVDDDRNQPGHHGVEEVAEAKG